jgi:hypothetical protein
MNNEIWGTGNRRQGGIVMKFKEVDLGLVYFDDFCNECGLFTGKTNLNGGYGCLAVRDEKESEYGLCMPGDCPLAYTASLADIKKYDEGLYQEHKAEYVKFKSFHGSEEDFVPSKWNGSDWLVQYRELEEISDDEVDTVRKDLRKMEREII